MNWSDEKSLTPSGHLLVRTGEYSWKMYHIGGKPFDWFEAMDKVENNKK